MRDKPNDWPEFANFMKHVIIGTAGHVDHGKTTLIHALTGTNPDRLKEEQERGMTIDIGFAALKLPDGTVAGIVDVPGHERFLKNMLVGASGVDVALVVVAADESVMPQTEEHLAILRLLDVRNGVVAMTKIDLVDRDWADAVERDIREHLQGTFLEKAPIVRVSTVTGKGIDTLRRALLSAVSRAESRNADLPFRLPVDRVFTRPGFGTVATGTLVAGTLRVGDAAEITPQGLPCRVRGLQIHGEKCKEAQAGSRVAVNLAGVEVSDLERGAQLVPVGAMAPTTTFDAVLRLLPAIANPLKDRARIRLHLGTAEIIGRIRLLDSRDSVEAGQEAYIQFQGETPFACIRGDRFIVRAYSPMRTIGGGIALDPAPPRHKKNDPNVLDALAARQRGTPEDLIETLLLRNPLGILRNNLPALAGMTAPDAESGLSALLERGTAESIAFDRVMLTAARRQWTDRVRAVLTAYHEQFPLRAGMPKEELRAALGREMDAKAFGSLTAQWQEEKILRIEANLARLSDFAVQLNDRQLALLERIEAYYHACGIETPRLEEVCRDVKAPPDAVNALLRVGTQRGNFVRVAEDVYYDAQTVAEMQKILRELVTQTGSLTVASFRDRMKTSRRFAMQALEYFDSVRFTRRNGDERLLSSDTPPAAPPRHP